MAEFLVKLAVPIGGVDQIEVYCARDPEHAIELLQELFGEEEIVVDSVFNAWAPQVCVWRRKPLPAPVPPPQGRSLVRAWRRMIDPDA